MFLAGLFLFTCRIIV